MHSRPMPVLAYHLILTFYGFWLPKDPRGSWSEFVRAWELRRFGPATKTRERRSLARDPHDVARRFEAKRHLARPQVHLSGLQARAVARGFGNYVARSGVRIHACSILPEHAHLVVARHRYSIEGIARHLKGEATAQFNREGSNPSAAHPYRNGSLPSLWARKEWKCSLFDEAYLGNAVRYVRRNPVRERMKAQDWSFVVPHAG